MKFTIIAISIVVVISLLSCSNRKTEKDIISEKIEQIVKSSELFKDSDLSKFEKYEEIQIKYNELPSYRAILSDIETYNTLLEEASKIKQGVKIENGLLGNYSKENIDVYIKGVTEELNRKKYRLSTLERLCTDKMYKVICEEHMTFGRNKTLLITHAHIYLNDKYEIVDFIH